jgi:transcriptional regulator of acetoin/glycerol metabolism
MAKVGRIIEFSKDSPVDLSGILKSMEKEAVIEAYKESKGVKAHAAKMLGMLRTNFYHKFKAYCEGDN